MAGKRIDWMDFAHQLHKERELMQDRMPDGVDCSLTLSCYGEGSARFSVSLKHRESKLSGYGVGTTPAKALDEAKAELAKNAREAQIRSPRVLGTSRPALAGRGELFT